MIGATRAGIGLGTFSAMKLLQAEEEAASACIPEQWTNFQAVGIVGDTEGDFRSKADEWTTTRQV